MGQFGSLCIATQKYDEHEAPPPRVLRTASNERLDAFRLRDAEAEGRRSVRDGGLGVVDLVGFDLASDLIVASPDMVARRTVTALAQSLEVRGVLR